MRRLAFSTRALAQAFADSVHSRMVAQNHSYRESVEAGQTLRWAIPYQDVDDNGTPISSEWFVNIKDRCEVVITRAERSAVVSDQEVRV